LSLFRHFGWFWMLKWLQVFMYLKCQSISEAAIWNNRVSIYNIGFINDKLSKPTDLEFLLEVRSQRLQDFRTPETTGHRINDERDHWPTKYKERWTHQKSLPSKSLSKICTEWPNVCSFRACHSEDQILPAITTQSRLRSQYQEIWLNLVLLDIVKSNPPLVCWKFSHHEIYHPMHKLINPIFSKKIK